MKYMVNFIVSIFNLTTCLISKIISRQVIECFIAYFCNTSVLYSEDALFESRLGLRLSWLRLSLVSSFSADKRTDSGSAQGATAPSNSLFPYHLTVRRYSLSY
jgi:hypothetical protein